MGSDRMFFRMVVVLLLLACLVVALTASRAHAQISNSCTQAAPIFTTTTNNATVLKATAGILCEWSFDNTTTSTFSIRFYDTATAPSGGAPCNSATNLKGAFVAQPNTVSPGRATTYMFGRRFNAGIVVCITGANGANDNSSAVTGGNFNASYQ